MKFNLKHIKAAKILTSQGWLNNAVISFNQEGLITAIAPYKDAIKIDHDMGDCWLMPGLIDSHVHGAMGHDVMDASHEALEAMSVFFASKGVVGFMPTTVTAPKEKIDAALLQVKQSQEIGVSGAQILGSYLEGPYFTEKHRGAHPPEWFRELTLDDINHWLSIAGGSLKAIALAPEKDNALEVIEYLTQQNVNVMLGHTDADFDTTHAALNAGAKGIVHCYNGMRGLHHRDPGVVGAGLCHPDAYVELIADGHHVHPKATDIAYRCCSKNRLTLITDAMQAAGMPDGQYTLGEYQVDVSGGVVRTRSGSLAGSTLTLDKAILNIASWLDLPLEEAWYMASQTPAKALGIDSELGSISVGKKASMVAITEQGEVQATWVMGKCVYSKAIKQINSEVPCI